MILVTGLLTLFLAALLLGHSQYRESVRDRSKADRDWGVVLSVTLFGAPFLAAAFAVVTLPVSLFLSGAWPWPLGSWPLWVQLAVLIPPLGAALFGAITLAEDLLWQGRFWYRSERLAETFLLLSIVLVPSALLFHLTSGWPLWLMIGATVVWLPTVSLLLLALVGGRRSDSILSFAERWFLVSAGALALFALCLVSFWFLAILPVGLLALLFASGGDYPADPSFTSRNC